MSTDISTSQFQHIIRQDCPLPAGAHVVIYCRDSGGEEQDRSVTQQEQAGSEYAARHNLIIDNIYKDDAKLSSNTESRTELSRLISDIHAVRKPIHDRYKRDKVSTEKPFGVVFWKSNRLGRDSIEATSIKTDLRLRGVTIIDLITSANTGNPAIDGVIEAIQQYQDEQLLDDISTGAKRGQASNVSTRDDDPGFLKYNPGWPSTGGYLGVRPGVPPTGFIGERVQIGVYSRKTGRMSGEPRIVQRMVPDPATWELCRTAWQMRHEGAKIEHIHNKLHLFKTINSYATFFANRIYMGDYISGGVVYENFVPAMIPKEWYEEEKKKIEERALKLQGKPISRSLEPGSVGSKYLLSGLVFCGAVEGEEHPMHIESTPGKKGKRGLYRFLTCNTAKNSRGQQCWATKHIGLRRLEAEVVENLMRFVLKPDVIRPVLEEYMKMLNDTSRDATPRITALEGRLTETRASISNILNSLERMGYATHLQERYDARRKEEEEILTELLKLRALRTQSNFNVELTDAALNQWLDGLKEKLWGTDIAEARNAMRQLVKKIVIRGGTATMHYSFPLMEGMPSFWELRSGGSLSETRQEFQFSVANPYELVD